MSEIQEFISTAISSNANLRLASSCNWYVLYTCPKSEKVVYRELIKRNYETFLPLTKTLRIWKNRQKKIIDLVLFPGYIFVNTLESELYKIKNVQKVVTYVRCGGKPSIVPIKDIDLIKKMLDLNQDITIDTKFYKGEKVRIIFGPLAGYEGILVKQKGKTRFGIRLEEINQTMLIEVCSEVLEKI